MTAQTGKATVQDDRNKERQKMNADHRIARIVGVLYIIGTVAGVLSVVFAGSILDDPDYLVKVSTNENRIITGALLVLTMGFALAMVPVLMFPILKKQNEVLALGYVVFRGALEAVTYIALIIVWLFLLTVSKEYVKAGTPDASYFQTLGASLLDTGDWISQIMAIPFCLGALMFYFLLYQTRLIPRWLSGWGLLAAIPYLASVFLAMFAIIEPDSTTQTVLMFPLAVQEMVMAVWLIVKGFNSSAIASGLANSE
jgi:hypothetical protein